MVRGVNPSLIPSLVIRCAFATMLVRCWPSQLAVFSLPFAVPGP